VRADETTFLAEAEADEACIADDDALKTLELSHAELARAGLRDRLDQSQ